MTDPHLDSLRSGLVKMRRLQEAMLDDDLAWILPMDLLQDVTALYGVPVIHAAVPVPFLAHRIQDADTSLLANARALIAELDAETGGPVTEAELENLRKHWPPQ